MGCRMCMNGCWIGIYYFIFQVVRVRCYDQYLAGHPDQTACHLATPGLMFIMNEENVRVSVQDDLLEDGGKAWVGYAMEHVNLQYIGCIHVDDLGDGIHYDETPANADLGECYRICYNLEKPVLGIQGDGRRPCKCFGNEVKQLHATKTGCTTTCRNDQFICGGYSRIALYEPVGEVNASVLSSSDNDKCLSVHNTRYNWEYCGTYYRPACITDKDGQKTKVGARSKPWASSVSQCFDRGWYPMGYSGKGWSAQKIYWTGIVQTRYVMQLWEWPPTPNDLMYGYAERDGSRFVLKFTFDRNALNQSICHGEPSETRTTILTSEPEIVSQTVVQNKNSPGHFLGDNNSSFTNNPMSTSNDKNTARKVEGSCYLQAQDGSPTDSECNLAAPNITFTSTHTELNIEQDVLQDGDKAWVGYAREAVILQYIGCISAEDIREENINFLEFPTVLNLGICFHICYQNGLAVVGIQGNTENRCKCFSLRIMSYEAKETDCNVKCSNNKFWCGGQTHISLYEQVVGGVIAKELYSQPDKCLATSKGTYIYNWRSCDDRLWSYCIGGRKDKTQMSPYKTDVWSGSIKHCFNEDWYPMVYRERPPLSRWSEYWMGVIKTTTVEALYNWPGEGEAMLGYVERTGDIYSLKFTDNKNDVNMSICLKADTSTTRSSTVPTTTPSTEEDRTELVPDTSRSANTAGIDQMPLANSKQDEGSIKVAFYIGVPAVILVIVVVVIVVCLKRRKRKNRLDKPAASNQHVRGAAYTNHHEGVPLQCDNEEDVYSEIHEEVDGAQYQDRNIEYGNNAEINAAMYDVYEAPDDKSTDKSLKVEVFDNQYQVPDDEDDVYEEPDKDTQTVRYNDAKHDIYYDAADEDYGTKSKASGDTEHDNNYQSKNSARIKTNVGSYFILEKEKPPIDSADNQVHIPMVQSGRAYNHVQLPNRADGQTDEYDHIGNVPGPRASRKDYNTTLVDTSNTYDTSTTVKVLPGATTTDNTYSKSVRRQ